MKTLNDTVELMASPDFKERFKAEYYQLVIRRDGLAKMVDSYKEGTLPFVPKCSVELLEMQLSAMNDYVAVMKTRANVEGVDLIEL